MFPSSLLIVTGLCFVLSLGVFFLRDRLQGRRPSRR
jgi:hypothetical protein